MATSHDRQVLVGNRLVLLGAVMYLLEWVAIVAGSVDGPFGPDTAPSHVVAGYSGHADRWGWAAAWFSVVLLGRVVFVVGLRAGLVASGRPSPLMDVAVAAMAVGVGLEIASYGLTTAAAVVASSPASGAVLALDRGAFAVNAMLIGPTGVAVLSAAVALWQSRLVGRVLVALGLVGGGVLVLAALTLGAPSQASAMDASTSAVVLVWVWMLWLGVLFWRRTPAGSRQPASPAGASSASV